eukprot:1157871-Pelagomonas_calceolata.AAC.7
MAYLHGTGQPHSPAFPETETQNRAPLAQIHPSEGQSSPFPPSTCTSWPRAPRLVVNKHLYPPAPPPPYTHPSSNHAQRTNLSISARMGGTSSKSSHRRPSMRATCATTKGAYARKRTQMSQHASARTRCYITKLVSWNFYGA